MQPLHSRLDSLSGIGNGSLCTGMWPRRYFAEIIPLIGSKRCQRSVLDEHSAPYTFSDLPPTGCQVPATPQMWVRHILIAVGQNESLHATAVLGPVVCLSVTRLKTVNWRAHPLALRDAWIGHLCFDILIFILTFYQSVRAKTKGFNDILSVMLRDGMCQYI